MDARNDLARALYDWIAEGGDPLALIGAKPVAVDKQLAFAPARVQACFCRYYPFHCTHTSQAWLRAKAGYWMQSMRAEGHPGKFDLLDPVAFVPPEEPKLARVCKTRVRYRPVAFNRSNAVYFTLRRMGIRSRGDITNRKWRDIMDDVSQRINQDPVLMGKCGGEFPRGSLDRLLQENIKGYKAYNPPRDEISFYDAFRQLYLGSGGMDIF